MIVIPSKKLTFATATVKKPSISLEKEYMLKNVAVMGLGWLGLPLAKKLDQDGYTVRGSTTRSEKLMELLNSGLAVRILQLVPHAIKGNFKSFIADANVLIICIPPNRDHTYPDRIRQITLLAPRDLKVIYISSSSVYGNPDTEVHEESPTQPERASGEWVLATEKLLENHFQSNLTIIRFAGLFGPDRHPGRFLSGKKALSRPKGKVNLIHLDDCIQLISAVISQQQFGYIINGCADNHPDRASFYSRAAHELSLPKPNFDQSDQKMGKTVSNKRSKELLGLTYQCPDPLECI